MKTSFKQGAIGRLGILAALTLFFALPAYAWGPYQYRNENGESRWGIKNGSDTIELNLKSRKKASRVAGKMNEVDPPVKAGPDGEGNT